MTQIRAGMEIQEDVLRLRIENEKLESDFRICEKNADTYYDKLTKATELLERFLGLGNLWNLDCKVYFPLRKEVKQFLKEIEK